MGTWIVHSFVLVHFSGRGRGLDEYGMQQDSKRRSLFYMRRSFTLSFPEDVVNGVVLFFLEERSCVILRSFVISTERSRKGGPPGVLALRPKMSLTIPRPKS